MASHDRVFLTLDCLFLKSSIYGPYNLLTSSCVFSIRNKDTTSLFCNNSFSIKKLDTKFYSKEDIILSLSLFLGSKDLRFILEDYITSSIIKGTLELKSLEITLSFEWNISSQIQVL